MTDYKEIATPSRTKAILEQHGFSFKKSLGQNFLTEPNILRKIVRTAEINEDDYVIEVGPGIGALTEQLAMHAQKVIALEIDARLLPVLADTLSPYPNTVVLHEDVLKADLAAICAKEVPAGSTTKVVANLPYYITTPIMLRFIESDLSISMLVVMMQKEVADRITAAPGTKAYGSLSIAVAYHMESEIAFIVPKSVFIPQPNVDSAIVKLTRRAEPAVQVTHEANFFALVKAAFAQRRKTLWNNLIHYYGKDEEKTAWLLTSLAEADIDKSRRGETLTLAEFAALANALEKNKPKN